MTTIRHEVHAACPPERVWALLADLEAVQHYNPGVRFKAFYLRLLEYARGQGIYQPSRRPRLAAGGASSGNAPAPIPRGRPSRPEQLTLFG